MRKSHLFTKWKIVLPGSMFFFFRAGSMFFHISSIELQLNLRAIDFDGASCSHRIWRNHRSSSIQQIRRCPQIYRTPLYLQKACGSIDHLPCHCSLFIFLNFGQKKLSTILIHNDTGYLNDGLIRFCNNNHSRFDNAHNKLQLRYNTRICKCCLTTTMSLTPTAHQLPAWFLQNRLGYHIQNPQQIYNTEQHMVSCSMVLTRTMQK